MDTVLATGGNVTTQVKRPTKAVLTTAGGGEPNASKSSSAIDRALQLLTDINTFRNK